MRGCLGHLSLWGAEMRASESGVQRLEPDSLGWDPDCINRQLRVLGRLPSL